MKSMDLVNGYSIHSIKLSYKRAWEHYVKFVRTWQKFSSESANSENNLRMSKEFAERIQPELVTAKYLAKMAGVRTEDEATVWNKI